MERSEKFSVKGVGGDFNVAFQIPTNTPVLVNTGRISIESGPRLRRVYWAPVLNPDNHLDYVAAQFLFYKEANLVGQMDFSWVGNDPNSALAVLSPCAPFHRLDWAGPYVYPYGSAFGPLASDPNSRLIQWHNLTGTPFSCQIVMNPTEEVMDCNAFECVTTILNKTIAGSASRQIVVAGVVSGRPL